MQHDPPEEADGRTSPPAAAAETAVEHQHQQRALSVPFLHEDASADATSSDSSTSSSSSSSSPPSPKASASSSSRVDPSGSVAPSVGEDAPVSGTFWLMFGLLSLVLVLAESSRGVVIPTLALYQQSLGGSTTFLGMLVAMFSVGRLGSSYIFGRYLARAHRKATAAAAASSSPEPPSERVNQSLLTGLLVSLVVVILGHALYIAASGAAAGGLSLLLLARLLVGFGTGTLVLARTFVGDQAPASRKSRFMAWLGIEQFVGFACTPALGSITLDTYIGRFHITTFNFGSYLLALLTAATFVGLFVAKRWMKAQADAHGRTIQYMQQQDGEEVELRQALQAPASASASSSSLSQPILERCTTCGRSDHVQPAAAAAATTKTPTPTLTVVGIHVESGDGAAALPVASSPPAPGPAAVSGASSTTSLWLLVVGNLLIRGSLSLAETFGSLIFFIVVGKGDSDQVSDSAEFFLWLGLGGVLVFLSVEFLVRWCTSRWVLCGALLAAMVGYALNVDFDGDLRQRHFILGMALIWSVSSPIAQTTIASQLSAELAERHKIAAAAAAAAAASSSHPLALPPPPSQALWMGHLTAAGSVGRILFPLLGGAVYSSNDTGGVMLLGLGAHLIFLVAYVYVHRGKLLADVRRTWARIRPAFGQRSAFFRECCHRVTWTDRRSRGRGRGRSAAVDRGVHEHQLAMDSVHASEDPDPNGARSWNTLASQPQWHE